MKCSLFTVRKLPERTEKPHKKGTCNAKNKPVVCPVNHQYSLCPAGHWSSELGSQRCECSGFREILGETVEHTDCNATERTAVWWKIRQQPKKTLAKRGFTADSKAGWNTPFHPLSPFNVYIFSQFIDAVMRMVTNSFEGRTSIPSQTSMLLFGCATENVLVPHLQWALQSFCWCWHFSQCFFHNC